MPASVRLAALAVPLLLLLAGCEDPAVSEAPVASPSVSLPGGHDACSLLATSDVEPALAPPSASPSPTPQQTPTSVHNLSLIPTTVDGTLQVGMAVDRCEVSDPSGQSVVLSIYGAQPAAKFSGKLSELTDLTRGASQITIGSTSAEYSQSATGAVIAFQDGADAVSISYPAAEPKSGTSREQRLVNLAARILEVEAPTVSPVAAPIAEASASASPTPNVPPGQPTSGATAAVNVNETDALKFDPATISVKVNGIVEWTNGGVSVHNVTFAGQPSITSKTMQQNDKFEVQFTKAGTFNYVCTFHVSSGMTGTVTVTS